MWIPIGPCSNIRPVPLDLSTPSLFRRFSRSVVCRLAINYPRTCHSQRRAVPLPRCAFCSRKNHGGGADAGEHGRRQGTEPTKEKARGEERSVAEPHPRDSGPLLGSAL